MAARNEQLSAFILEHYAVHGVDIQSMGDDSMVVNLPPAFRELTDFCCSLYEEFGCLVELEYDNDAVRAIIWHKQDKTVVPPSESTPAAPLPPVHHRTSNCFFTSAMVVGLLACAVYYLYVMRAQSFRQDVASLLLWMVNYI